MYAAEAIGGDRENALRLCAGFPEDSWGDCMQGAAGGIALHHIARDRDALLLSPILPGDVLAGCFDAPAPFDKDCLIHLGWHMGYDIIQPEGPAVPELDRFTSWVSSIPDPSQAALFNAGLGFWFSDHYSFEPNKFSGIFPVEQTTRTFRTNVALGIGYHLAHSFDAHERIVQLCARYAEVDPELESPCLQGAALHRSQRDHAPPTTRPEPGRLRRASP